MLFGTNIVFAEDDGLFLNPIASVIDSQGFVYIVDHNNHNVQKFDSNGKFVSKWESKNKGNTMFEHPLGISIDSKDNIYVVDQNHGKIKKLSDSGYVAHSFGKLGYSDDNLGSPEGEFAKPSHIAIDSKDNIYVVDYGSETIQKFSIDGTFILKWGSEGEGDGQFNTPLGIAIDSSDNVYVLDEGLSDAGQYSRVEKFSSDGKFITEWGSHGIGDGKFLSASGIAIDSSDVVYVTDFRGEYMQKFSSDGKFLEKILIQPTNNNDDNYSGMSSIAIDYTTGNFYITNSIDKYVSKFSPEGTLLAKWGGEANWDEVIQETKSQSETTGRTENGIYSEAGYLISLLEKNQNANILFYLDPALQENMTKAVMKYFIETQDNVILETGKMITIPLDSPESKQPIVVPFSWKHSGSYFLRQQVEYTDDEDNPRSHHSSLNQIIIVDKIGKAVNEEGLCKKEGLIPTFKHDFSKVACVSYPTSLMLFQRGW